MHGWDGPIGIFRFKYRSRGKSTAVLSCMGSKELTLGTSLGDLQKECIINRTPTPEPPKPLSVDELTPEQKKRLAPIWDLMILKCWGHWQARHQHIPGQSSVDSHRRFEDLTSEEIDQLVIEKHGEMTVRSYPFKICICYHWKLW